MGIIPAILMAIALQPSDAPRDTKPPVLPGEVRTALEKNAKSFDNLLISGARSQRMLAPAETVLKAIDTREPESTFTQSVRFELRFQGAKFRESLRYPQGKYHSGNDVWEKSFDGTRFFSADHDPQEKVNPGTLIITTPALDEAEVKLQQTEPWTQCFLWYLLEAGFSGPTRGDKMGRPVESLVLARAAAGEVVSVKGVGQESEKLLEVTIEYPEPWESRRTNPVEKDPKYVNLLNGTDKYQMRIERERRQLAGQRRLCRFLLDGGKGYAVREEWESRKETGALMFHTKNSDFVQAEPGGAWLPRLCEVDSCAYYTAPLYASPKPLYQTIIQVEKLERTTFVENDFRLWYPAPGLLVEDYTNPKSTIQNPHMYRVVSSTDALDITSGRSFFASNRMILVVLLNVLMAGILGVFVYVRARRKA
jgi:hypothetical protein